MVVLRYVALHYFTLRYVMLHCITVCYVASHYIALHYIILHYIVGMQACMSSCARPSWSSQSLVMSQGKCLMMPSQATGAHASSANPSLPMQPTVSHGFVVVLFRLTYAKDAMN